MKPIDHPEFFRLPPPAGRSRESKIRLDRRGCFWEDGEEVKHARMREAFFGWLRRHPDDDRYILCNGYDWTYLTVEDEEAPLRIQGIHADQGRLYLDICDESREEFPMQGARVGNDGGIVVPLRRGLSARLTPAAQLQLSPYLEESEAGEFILRSEHGEYRLGSKMT